MKTRHIETRLGCPSLTHGDYVRPLRGRFVRASASPPCLHDGGRFMRTRVDGSERAGWRNPLWTKRLAPEVARHQQLQETLTSEFESLPPSHISFWCNRLRRVSVLLKSLPLGQVSEFRPLTYAFDPSASPNCLQLPSGQQAQYVRGRGGYSAHSRRPTARRRWRPPQRPEPRLCPLVRVLDIDDRESHV